MHMFIDHFIWANLSQSISMSVLYFSAADSFYFCLYAGCDQQNKTWA
ncbi:Hypothetical protein CFV354_1406 [Campylobacter fetus subsp. venerealis NCTC 10354]|nr:Hypothetical protein CFV354_1406 [Campylobacter fetus subsp. venerealis NCTC 10354]